MPEKINASRFCDLQGVDDMSRNIIERKFRGQMAFLDEWHATLTKEGFELHPLRDFTQYKSGKVAEKEPTKTTK